MKKWLKILLAISIPLTVAGIGVGIGISLSKKEEENDLARQMKEYYDMKLKLFEEQNENIVPGETEVVFIGDSLTDGCDLQKYYPNFNALNRGIGGDTTYNLYKRLELSLSTVKPQAVVMLIGCNNLDTMFVDYENILKWYETNIPESKIVVCSLTALGGNWARNNDKCIVNNQTIKSLTVKYSLPYVDLFTPLVNNETKEIFPEYTIDGAHLTDAGYRIVSSQITPVLNELLEK